MIVQKPEAERKLGKKLKGRKTDWFLLSTAGTRRLGGPYRARADAETRERQVQFFKQKQNPEKAVGGLADRMPDSAFDAKQLKRGIKVELEHTTDRKLAKEIAKDHLVEDPEYYEKLAAIEGEKSKYRLEENPLKKIAELHPEDRAIVGSAIGSAAGYMVSPAVAPIGAAAGHLAAKKIAQRKKNPGKKQRSLRTIAKEIKASWPYPWGAPSSDRLSARVRETVGLMETLCNVEDVADNGKTGKVLVGNFLANAGTWHGADARRIKSELRTLWRQRNPKKVTKKQVKKVKKRVKKLSKKHEKSLKGAAVGTAVGGVVGSLGGPATAAVGAGAGSYVGAKVAARNPKSFLEREHDWDEVLIQKDGKKITRKKILDYYKKNKKKLWPFLQNQTVMVLIGTSKNDFPRLRKGPDGKYIKLTKLEGIDDPHSFEYWIYRRTIEFHPVLTGKKTPIMWLDIDIHARAKAKKASLRKKARLAIPKLRRIMRKFGVERIHAYDSGIGGYHLEGNLKTPKNVDKLRKEFTAALKSAFEGDKIFTTGIAKSGQIRLDTTTMHTLGSLRAPYSFTVAGGKKQPIRGKTR